MRYHFGPFELDASRRTLSDPSGPIPLQPRAMSVLVLLVESRHRVVRFGELVERVWVDEVVTAASLRQAVRSIRRALGDDGDAQGAIRTVPRHGYQFVAGIAGDDVPRERHVVGREAELAELRGALDAATRGAARLVLIEGEAGIGKSTLLHAFAESMRGDGVAVAVGNAHPHDDAPPFWPWIRALRELEARAQPPRVTRPRRRMMAAAPQGTTGRRCTPARGARAAVAWTSRSSAPGGQRPLS